MRKRSLVLLIFGVAAAVLVVAGGVAWRVLKLSDMATIGAGYTAQQTCACVFISRRPVESCRSDLESLAQRLVKVEVGAQEVTARSMAGVARATARYDRTYGCQLVD